MTDILMDKKRYQREMGMGGIYIHVPFCLRKCNYCSFFSISSLRMDEYLDALEKSIKDSPYEDFKADTIYFGGGTPSLLSPDQIERIISVIKGKFKISSPEITIEVNPGTVKKGYFRELFKTGVNRLNIGVQSLNDENLSLLGRIHDSKAAVETYVNAREEGFSNTGLDLIYGIPGQELKELEKDISSFIGLSPKHISAYMLSVEEGTKLDSMIEKGVIPDIDEGMQADFFLHVKRKLQSAGYLFYEVSNYGKQGFFSRHNLKYWNHQPYLGFGPSAHSFYFPLRWKEPDDFNLWVSNVNSRMAKGRELEFISEDMEATEFLYLGFRQAKGVDMKEYERRFGLCFNEKYGALNQELIKGGYMNVDGDFLFLTENGFLFLDHITARYV